MGPARRKDRARRVKDTWDSDLDSSELNEGVLEDYVQQMRENFENSDDDDDDNNSDDLQRGAALRAEREKAAHGGASSANAAGSRQRDVADRRSRAQLTAAALHDNYSDDEPYQVSSLDVDEYYERHRDDDFELAKLSMAGGRHSYRSKRDGKLSRGDNAGRRGVMAGALERTGAGGGGGGGGGRRHLGAEAFELEALRVSPNDKGVRAKAVGECLLVLQFARSRKEELILSRTIKPVRIAVERVSDACRIETYPIGKGADRRVALVRTADTQCIRTEQMDRILDDMFSAGKYGRRRDESASSAERRPKRENPRREMKRRALEDTANGVPLGESNAGHLMLRSFGWASGSGLGVDRNGRTDPVPVRIYAGRRGLQLDDDAPPS